MTEQQEPNKAHREEQDGQQEYALYTEQIEKKPWYRRRRYKWMLIFAAVVAVLGIVGVCLYPTVSPWFFRKMSAGTSELSISKDEYPTEETQAATDPEQVDLEDASDENTDTTASTDNYEAVLSSLQSRVADIQQSIVTVDDERFSVDELITESQQMPSTVGVIIGESTTRYVVMTSYSAITDLSTIYVRINDSAQISGIYLGGNKEAGVALISVRKSEIPQDYRDVISVASLGNSYKMKQGSLVIAAGKLHGQNKAVDYGMISSVTEQSVVDNCYSLLKTNISVSTDDYGYLFNANGNLVGVSMPNADGDTISTIGISNLKTLVERLSNVSDAAYCGIVGQNVTTSLASTYHLPMGLYISQVELESPAYVAGLQPGDVITAIDGESVLTIQAFSEKLYQCTSGQSIVITVERMGKDEYKEIPFTVTLTAAP